MTPKEREKKDKDSEIVKCPLILNTFAWISRSLSVTVTRNAFLTYEIICKRPSLFLYPVTFSLEQFKQLKNIPDVRVRFNQLSKENTNKNKMFILPYNMPIC